MSQRTYPVGTTSIPLEVTVNDGGPATGLTVTAKIVIPAANLQFDFSDDTFKTPVSVVTPTDTLVESTVIPGVYQGTWNTSTILTDADAVVVYQSTASTIFVRDDQVSFQGTASTGGDRTYPVSTASVPLVVLINDNGPVTGATVTGRILEATGLQFDFSDDTFKAPVSVVTPTVTLTEYTPVCPGLYYATWNTTSILAPTDPVAVYESSSPSFIIDDTIGFHTVPTTGGGGPVVNDFIEAVFDQTNNTLTIVGGLKNNTSGLIPSTTAVFTVKNELNQVLLAQTSNSLTGIHRVVFPNVQIAPNRILLIFTTFTAGISTFSTIDTLATLGVTSGVY